MAIRTIAKPRAAMEAPGTLGREFSCLTP